MTSRGLVLVTGATGNVGREVVRSLRAQGFPVRTATSEPERARRLFGDDVDAARLDYFDSGTFAILDGVESLFLMRPPAISNVKQTLLPFVDEARRRGVRHIVFLSVAGAGTNPLVPHHAVERHLMKGTAWSILRPGFFAQNLGDAYLRDIVEDARLYVPAGRGRVAFVDVRDLADLTALIFAEPATFESRGLTLTGPEALDFDGVAAILSAALGRNVRYQPASILGYVQHLHGRGLPWAQVAVQTVLHCGLRFGQAERVDPTLEQLLSRRPRSLADYVRDHVRSFDPRPGH